MKTPQTNHCRHLKQGHRRKNWKVRLFVLRSEPAFLHYFDPTKVSVQRDLWRTNADLNLKKKSWALAQKCFKATANMKTTHREDFMTWVNTQLWQWAEQAWPKQSSCFLCRLRPTLTLLPLLMIFTTLWLLSTSFLNLSRSNSCLMSLLRTTSAPLEASHCEAVWYLLWTITEFPQVSHCLQLQQGSVYISKQGRLLRENTLPPLQMKSKSGLCDDT